MTALEKRARQLYQAQQRRIGGGALPWDLLREEIKDVWRDTARDHKRASERRGGR